MSLTIEHLFRDPAVVVSGGVSLGSYQGGFLDFYSRYMKTTRQELLKGLLALVPPEVPPARLPRVPTRFDIATGASAGSINALLAGLVGCRDNTLDPMPDARDPGKELNVEDSIFYQVWHPVGFGKLFKPGEVGSSNLFDDSSTGPVNARIEHVREILQKTTTGWRDCQFDLGITVTRLGKRDIDLMNYAAQKAPNVQSLIPRATEKLMFTWAYGGNPAELTATGFEFADDWRYDVYPRLLPSGVTTAGAKLSPKDVLDAVKASSTFPVAFKPTSLTMTHYADGMWSPPEQADYFDGGAFNNNPLDIALTLHRERQGPGGPNARSYLYLDPDIVDWQFTDTVLKKKPDAGLLTTFSPFLGSAFSVASNSQLMSALETSPELRGRIELPARRGATASDYLVAMVGFFEPEFRRFDFYRGMVDATRFIDGSAESIVANLLGRSLVEPVVAALGSPTLDCMIGFEREQTMVAPACAGPVDDNMRALMRVTRQMRLYERNARVVREQVFTMQTPMVQPAGATCYQLPRCDQCRAMSVRPSDGLSGCEPSRWFGVSEAECNKCVARAPGLLCAPALSEADWFELFMEQLKNDGKGEGTKKCGETPAFRFTKVDLDTTPEGFRSEMRSKVGKAVSKLVAKQESPFERTALHTAAEIGLDLGLERQARSFWTVGGSGGGSGLSVDVGYSLMGGQNARFGGQLVGRFVPFASHQIPPTDSGLGFVNRTELALVPRAVFSVGPWPGEALFWDFTVGASLRAGWFEFLGNHIGGAKGFQPGPDLVLLSPEVTVGASIIDRVGLHVRWTIDPWAWELHGKRVPSALHSGSTLPQIPLGNINLGFEWRIW
ncbi:patatin-like phospholipase family protein [Archangium lansingense]|uniref:patatin-like phospholipase family protein n=1 Tax=Archangium lansingense TaxID=2995310 RepID=UPI003B7723ED